MQMQSNYMTAELAKSRCIHMIITGHSVYFLECCVYIFLHEKRIYGLSLRTKVITSDHFDAGFSGFVFQK